MRWILKVDMSEMEYRARVQCEINKFDGLSLRYKKPGMLNRKVKLNLIIIYRFIAVLFYVNIGVLWACKFLLNLPEPYNNLAYFNFVICLLTELHFFKSFLFSKK